MTDIDPKLKVHSLVLLNASLQGAMERLTDSLAQAHSNNAALSEQAHTLGTRVRELSEANVAVVAKMAEAAENSDKIIGDLKQELTFQSDDMARRTIFFAHIFHTVKVTPASSTKKKSKEEVAVILPVVPEMSGVQPEEREYFASWPVEEILRVYERLYVSVKTNHLNKVLGAA